MRRIGQWLRFDGPGRSLRQLTRFSRAKLRWSWLVLALIVLAALLVRIWHLDLMWASRDECFSWRLIQYSPAEQVERTAADVHPPLYYLTLSSWSAVFGRSMGALRSMSILLSLATVPLLYLAVAESLRWSTQGALSSVQKVGALFAAALVAFHPWQITAARTARMYSLGILLAALSAWLLLRALRAGRHDLVWWLAYGLALAAFCYTHYFAFFTVAAQCVFVVGFLLCLAWRKQWRESKRIASGALIAACLSAMLFGPWALSLLDQVGQVRGGYWISKPEWHDVRQSLMALLTGADGLSMIENWTWGAVAVGLTFIAVWRLPAMLVFWLLQVAVPWGACLAISWYSTTPLFQERYMVFSQVAVAGGMGMALAQIASVPLQLLAGWVVGTMCAFGTSASVSAMPAELPAVARAMKFVEQHSQPGDLILAAWHGEVNRLRYYAFQAGLTHVTVGCLRRPRASTSHTVHIASLTDDDFIDEDELGKQVRRWWTVDPAPGSSIHVAGIRTIHVAQFDGSGDYSRYGVALCIPRNDG